MKKDKVIEWLALSIWALIGVIGMILAFCSTGCSQATEYDRCMALCEASDYDDRNPADAYGCRTRLRTNQDCHTECGHNLDRAYIAGCYDLAHELLDCQEMSGVEAQCADCSQTRMMLNECIASYEN